MTVNLGYEIKHTTDEAIEMDVTGASHESKEREPSRISLQLIKEYVMRKKLQEILSFCDMVNQLALSCNK